MRNESRVERVIAWGLVAGLHIGIFWLLTYAPVARRVDTDPFRMRLVLIPKALAPNSPVVPVAPLVTTGQPRRKPQARVIDAVQPRLDDAMVAPVSAVPAPIENTVDWQQQARAVVRQQAASDAMTFAPDPLRSRRARLPGGGPRRDTFVMHQAVTPAHVAGFIGGLFGGYPPPCPRVRENIAGLLTSTSGHDRELLQEELRQQREYCAP